MSLQSSTSVNVIDEVISRYPNIRFVADKTFYWAPQDKSVHYSPEKLTSETGLWSLLHEIAHGLLGHITYTTDYELLACEVAAWDKAIAMSRDFQQEIDQNHVEDCLDSYRDWLYARSTCPTCKLNSLQVKPDTYKCLNCTASWQVSPSRFCRPYRLKKTSS